VGIIKPWRTGYSKSGRKKNGKIINQGIDLGINYIDTAASYGQGVSQLNIGRVMKTREEVWLSTKTHDQHL
jgi:aryl-alcohol dehydrogenase-like predicted oxidoreductase